MACKKSSRREDRTEILPNPTQLGAPRPGAQPASLRAGSAPNRVRNGGAPNWKRLPKGEAEQNRAAFAPYAAGFSTTFVQPSSRASSIGTAPIFSARRKRSGWRSTIMTWLAPLRIAE
jgi:hypothetical protein